MTLIWCMSPLLGFLLVPLLGSLSDRCKFKLGRRRPFILLLSAGIILGLILVPNGRSIGVLMGDNYIDDAFISSTTNFPVSTTTESTRQNDTRFNIFFPNVEQSDYKSTPSEDSIQYSDTITEEPIQPRNYPHPFSILFTVLGVILLDFSCDACQSPCRAYMLDVTVPEDHSRGLSTFTVLAGKIVLIYLVVLSNDIRTSVTYLSCLCKSLKRSISVELLDSIITFHKSFNFSYLQFFKGN